MLFSRFRVSARILSRLQTVARERSTASSFYRRCYPLMEYPREYLQGIKLFNEEAFFEAHEVWESLWKRSQGRERLFYQALIQSAAAFLHQHNGNRRGALQLARLAAEKFAQVPDGFQGLDVRNFCGKISRLIDDSTFKKNPKIVLGARP